MKTIIVDDRPAPHACAAVRFAMLAALVLLVGGCASMHTLFPGLAPQYKGSKVERPLDVPPDLTALPDDTATQIPGAVPAAQTPGGPASGPGSQGASSQVAPPIPGIRVVRDGSERWLVIDLPPDQVWPRVRAFWLENGFVLEEQDPRVGTMQTNWRENRTMIPEDPIRRLITRILPSVYSAPTRDQYRVRVEAGTAPGTTDLYLSQRGVKQVAQGDGFIWEARAPDPDQEATMLRRLMVFLGVHKARAQALVAGAHEPPPRAELIRGSDGDLSLRISEPFDRAWQRTGIALDRVGFLVQAQNRAKGVYYVRYDDPLKDQEKRSLLGRLFGSKQSNSDRYWVRLQQQPTGQDTRVVVLSNGGKPNNSKTAQRILTVLQEQLR
ncbi:MAG: hypothetical protein B7Z66_00925 [Chromatiales bacterium 21-64-14]|nr:MAG: hypothetical protein B7Z66_00925 [Chromatiales bacterium 21-64-14]HQU16917.1 outer membrane protein assembly factor BamC [Gammaproteobacteria bacterium]